MGLGNFIRRNVKPLQYIGDLRRANVSQAFLNKERHSETEKDGAVSSKVPSKISTNKIIYDDTFHPNYHSLNWANRNQYRQKAGFLYYLVTLLTLPQYLAKYIFQFIPHRIERFFEHGIHIARGLMFIFAADRERKAVKKALLTKKGRIQPSNTKADHGQQEDELFPRDLVKATLDQQEYASEVDVPSRAREIGLGALVFLMSIFYYTFKAIRYLARAALSPYDHAKAGWEAGYKRQEIIVRQDIFRPSTNDTLIDDQGRYVMSPDGGKTFYPIKKWGDALLVDESGHFVPDTAREIKAESILTIKAFENNRRVAPKFNCVRKTKKDVLVSQDGDFIDDTGLFIRCYRDDNGLYIKMDADGQYERAKVNQENQFVDSEGNLVFVPVEGEHLADPNNSTPRVIPPKRQDLSRGAQNENGDAYVVSSGPVRTGWSYLYAGFNILTSIALLVVTFKYLASSAVAWIADKVGLTSTLGVIETAQIPHGAAVFFEASVAAAAVVHTPGVVREMYRANCKELDEDEQEQPVDDSSDHDNWHSPAADTRPDDYQDRGTDANVRRTGSARQHDSDDEFSRRKEGRIAESAKRTARRAQIKAELQQQGAFSARDDEFGAASQTNTGRRAHAHAAAAGSDFRSNSSDSEHDTEVAAAGAGSGHDGSGSDTDRGTARRGNFDLDLNNSGSDHEGDRDPTSEVVDGHNPWSDQDDELGEGEAVLRDDADDDNYVDDYAPVAAAAAQDRGQGHARNAVGSASGFGAGSRARTGNGPITPARDIPGYDDI